MIRPLHALTFQEIIMAKPHPIAYYIQDLLFVMIIKVAMLRYCVKMKNTTVELYSILLQTKARPCKAKRMPIRHHTAQSRSGGEVNE